MGWPETKSTVPESESAIEGTRISKWEVGEKDLKRENVSNDEAVINGNGNEARIGRETTRTSLLVRFSELHHRIIRKRRRCCVCLCTLILWVSFQSWTITHTDIRSGNAVFVSFIGDNIFQKTIMQQMDR